MTPQDLKQFIGTTQRREFGVIPGFSAINLETRTVEVAFSSEEMVMMPHGLEVLSHEPGAAMLNRINQGGSVLINHDFNKWIGGVEKAWQAQERKCRARLRIGESALSNDTWPDIASGLRKSVSFTYIVHDVVPARTADGQFYKLVTKWEPLEISFASVPVDISVGVGRSIEQSQQDKLMSKPNNQETGGQATQQQTAPPPAQQAQTEQRSITPTGDQAQGQQAQPPPTQQEPQPSQQAQPVQQRQRDLSANVVISGGNQAAPPIVFNPGAVEIRALAMKHNALNEGLQYIVEGRSVTDFKDFLLSRAEANDAAHKNGKTVLGLSKKEQRQFSFQRAMRIACFPDNEEFRKAGGFELECSRETQKLWPPTQERSISIPPELLMSEELFRHIQGNTQSRAFNLSAGAGAIDSGLRPQDFVELLRNLTLAYQLGVRFIGDVRGTPNIPKHTSAGAAGWVTEDADATTADDAIGSSQVVPKHISATQYITRSMLLEDSIGIESLLVSDQFEKLGLGIDKAVFHGTGSSGQPTGLAAGSINSVAIGTNGGNPTYAKLIEFLTKIDTANAFGGDIAYVTTPGVKGFAMQTLKNAGIAGFLWDPTTNTINGYPAYATNQIASNLTKGSSSGVCHAMFAGRFNQFIVFGWGPLEMNRDSSSASVKGGVRLTSFQSVDFFIRQPGAFSGCLDLTIT